MPSFRSFVSSLACGLLACASAIAQCTPVWLPGDPTPTLSGSIVANTTWDPDGAGPAASQLIAVGEVTGGQVWRASIAAWDGTQWLRLGTPPAGRGLSAVVWNGTLVAAFGEATTVRVASWNGATWQVLGTCTAFAISAPLIGLAVHQGQLHVGGNFTLIDGSPFSYAARWDGSAWSSLGAGPQFPGANLVSFQGVLYYAGNNVQAPGSGLLQTWNGSSWTAVASCNHYIETMAVRNGTSLTNTFLYVGGRFTQFTGVNGPVAGPVVRYSPSANSWASLAYTPNTAVRELRTRSTGLTTFELVAVDNNGLWQLSGGSWVQLGTQVPNAATTNFYSGAWHLMALGGATATAQRLQSGAWVPLTPNVTPLGYARAARAVGNDTVVGGTFGIRQGQTGAWNALGGLSGSVDELARLANGDLVAAGSFSLPGSGSAFRIARWNGSTWTSMTTSLNGSITAMQPLANGDLVVAGNFTAIDGVGFAYIARWNGSAWQPLGGGMNQIVKALALLPNGELVAGGDFTLAGSLTNTALYVARWTGSTWTAMSAPAPVRALTVEGAGTVVTLDASFQAWRWNGTAWQFLRVTPADAVLALPGGDLLFAGGNFVERTDAASVQRWAQSCNGAIEDLFLAADGDVLMAGSFDGLTGIASVGVARLDAPCPATSLATGPGCTGSAGPLVLTPTALPWVGETFRAVATGLPAIAFGVTVTGFATTSLPLLAVFPTALPGCTLHATPDVLEIALATGGAVSVQLVVPNDAALVGIVLQHQVVSLQFDAALNFTEVTATNALQSTVGVL